MKKTRNAPRHWGNIFCSITAVCLCAALFAGCTGHFAPIQPKKEVLRNEYAVVVTATAQDTLAGLAESYLKSSSEAWRIAQYNGIKKVSAGDRIVIPLAPVSYGGLSPNGYQTIPVLLYEKVTGAKKKATDVSIGEFKSQMATIRESGYRTVRLDQLTAFLNLEGQLPSKAIVITFDTTERWVYETAYPILKSHGFTAAVFITANQIGKTDQLDWSMLSEMAAEGFDIGAAGQTGRRLTKVKTKGGTKENIAFVEEEILGPQKQIESHLKMPCRYFAYPYGQSDDLVVALLKKHGYRAAFTRKQGDNPFYVDNFKIYRTTIGAKGSHMRFDQNLTTFVSADLQ